MKLNPMMMENPKVELTNKQSRQLMKFQKNIKKSEIYKSIRDEMTTLPEEEYFHLQNKPSQYEREVATYEESVMQRSSHGKAATKMKKKTRKINFTIQRRRGRLGKIFLNSNYRKLQETEKLVHFKAGGSFETTVGAVIKKQEEKEGNKHFIKGPWQRKKRIIWEHSDKGKRVLERRKWRKFHPLQFNPAKVKQLKGPMQKTAKKILGMTGKSRKVKILQKKVRSG